MSHGDGHESGHGHGLATAVDVEAEAARGLRGLGALLLVVGALCLSGGLWLLLRTPAPTPGELLEHAAAELSAGRAEAAWQSASRAAREAPQDADAWLLCGRALRAAGRTAEARESLERACALAPARWAPQLELARACLELGDTERAREALQAARSLAPDEAEVRALARELGG